MNDPNMKTTSSNGPPEPLPPSLPSQTPKGSGVPVGLGAVLGMLLLAPGVGMCFTDLSAEPNPLLIRTIGALLTVVGATLAGGGAFVLYAEGKARTVTMVPVDNTSQEMKRAPKWAYTFATISFVGVFIGSLLGLHFAGYSGRFLPGAIVGAIVGPVGAVVAVSCITVSRNTAISVPRRIYGCVLTVGFSCPITTGITWEILSLIK